MTIHGLLNPLDPPLGWINAPVHVHTLAGRPVLMHFWNHHDERTREQWPQLLAELEPRVRAGLAVVGVHVARQGDDLDSQVVEEVVQSIGFPYPVAIDDGLPSHSIAVAHGVTELPCFLLFNASGKLMGSVIRPVDLEGLGDALDVLLDQAQAERVEAPAPGP